MPTPKRDIRVLFTIVLALCLLFSATYASRLARKNQVDAEIARWEQKIEHSKERQYALENELRYIRSDAYIQKLAHDEFGMVRPTNSWSSSFRQTDGRNGCNCCAASGADHANTLASVALMVGAIRLTSEVNYGCCTSVKRQLRTSCRHPDSSCPLLLRDRVDPVTDELIRISASNILALPTVLRLRRYINVPRRGVRWSRRGVLRRDGYRCIYCGIQHGGK
ncbi:MAG: septum formation initiator family protein [Caldilineaceae bacterium]